MRNIVEINKDLCIGCGLCVDKCHEGAIKLIDGKATLIRDDYCDGLGDCLPHCPVDAIKIVKRECVSYNHEAVMANIKESIKEESVLKNFPIQLKLVQSNSPILNNSHLLIAADCTAFCYPSFHKDFMENRVCLIGCPKLDFTNYQIKISEIIANNNIKSITVVRMEVPCCGGLTMAVKNAIIASGQDIHYSVRTISTSGELINDIK